MAGTWSRSFEIFKQSLGVLKKDKELVLFPIISGMITVILTASFLVPVFFLIGVNSDEVQINPAIYVLFFLFYIISYFVVIFFNTGLIACAQIRLSGGDPSFRDGIRIASGNIGKIAGWALISATVGVILQMMRENLGLIGRIAAGLFGLAWNLLTFFVIPVMIFESQPVTGSIKRSAELFKRTWGENVVLRGSLGILMFLLGLIAVIPIALAALTKSAVVIITVVAVAVIYWFALGIFSASLNGIFSTALYNYANTGIVPTGFTPETIAGAFGPKRQRGL
jgi:Family of unknown function (DUF6159)